MKRCYWNPATHQLNKNYIIFLNDVSFEITVVTRKTVIQNNNIIQLPYKKYEYKKYDDYDILYSG